MRSNELEMERSAVRSIDLFIELLITPFSESMRL